MTDFIRVNKKNSKVRKDISQIIDKINEESYLLRSKIGRNALFQRKVFKQALNVMGDTINDMNIELEQKDNKIFFSGKKIGVPDFKIIKEMNKFKFNKLSIKDENDRIMNRLKKTLNIHKYILT